MRVSTARICLAARSGLRAWAGVGDDLEVLEESSPDSSESMTPLLMTLDYGTLTLMTLGYLKPPGLLLSSESLMAKAPHSLTLTFLRLKLLLL